MTKLSPGNMCPEQIFHGCVLCNNCGVVKSHEGRVVLFADGRRETSRDRGFTRERHLGSFPSSYTWLDLAGGRGESGKYVGVSEFAR